MTELQTFGVDRRLSIWSWGKMPSFTYGRMISANLPYDISKQMAPVMVLYLTWMLCIILLVLKRFHVRDIRETMWSKWKNKRLVPVLVLMLLFSQRKYCEETHTLNNQRCIYPRLLCRYIQKMHTLRSLNAKSSTLCWARIKDALGTWWYSRDKAPVFLVKECRDIQSNFLWIGWVIQQWITSRGEES